MKIDLDHFETLEELERDLIVWIKEEDLYAFDRYLNKEDILKIVQLLIKKENIIKEVREYIMTELITEWDIKNNGYVSGSDLPVDAITPILEILDKENK